MYSKEFDPGLPAYAKAKAKAGKKSDMFRVRKRCRTQCTLCVIFAMPCVKATLADLKFIPDKNG